MTILRESPWYQQILQEGLDQGRQEGRQEGELAMILRQLRRLGEVPPQLRERLGRLSINQLEELGEAIFDLRQLKDLEAWLDQHQ